MRAFQRLVHRFQRLVRELQRRSVWQVLGVFLAASWGVVEAVDLLTEQVGLPDWTPTMALVLLLIGFPVVLATAIVQEGLPGTDGDGEPGGESLEEILDGATAAEPAPPSPSPAAGSPDRPSTARRLFTWRNTLLGGLGAFTLLGISIFAYFVMWTSGIGPMGNLVAQGVFAEGETVVLADWDDDTDANLGDVVTEAIRVDLNESPVISLVTPAYVSQGLARMGRPPDARFSAATARELALRDGLKAVIQGEVSPVGSGYLLTASVVAAESGDVLKAVRVAVTSEHELLAGIDKLSQEIREKSGESLRSIRQGTGLEEATTASLDALRLYTQAVAAFDQGRQLEAVPLLEEALELDPEFAMAWRKLSVIYNNTGLEPDRMREASQRAYELRRRLTEREAGLAEAWYHNIVEDNPEAAIEAYRRVLDRYPNDPTALNNIAVRYLMLGRWAESEAPLRKALTGAAPSATHLSNLIQVLWNVGKPDEAWMWHDSLTRAYPDATAARTTRHWLLAGERRWKEAHDVAEGLWRDAPTGGLQHIYSLSDMAGYDLARGRYAEAMDHLASARREAVEAGAYVPYYQATAFLETVAALALEGPGRARATLVDIGGDVPLDSVAQRNVAHASAAHLHALSGAEAEGRRLFSAWEEAFAAGERGRAFRFQRELQRASEAWGRGSWSEAATTFDRLNTELRPCADMCIFAPEWGVALDEADRDQEALEVYGWYLENTQLSWHAYRTMWIPQVLERVARIHEDRGDTVEAEEAYRRIVEEFSEGDGPFVAFVERARTRLAALQD